MSNDYADLVNYIRKQTEWCSRSMSGGDWFAIDPDAAPFLAADAIEALVKAKDDLAEQSNEWCGIAERETKRAEAAEAEVERLKERAWEIAKIGMKRGADIRDYKKEVAKLKEALGDVKRWSQIDLGPLPHESQVLVKLQACFEIARRALGEGK